jgi:hypothetical protein
MRRRRAWHLSAIAGTAAASLVRRGPVRGQLRRQPWTPSRQSRRPRAARGPVTRVLLKPGAPGCWGPLSWAFGSFFRHGFAPSTGPARPGSLARCGEHATAAGPGSVPGPGGGSAENCHGPGSVTPEEREARLGEKMYARFQFDSTSLQRCARSCCTRLPVQPLAVTSLR